MPLVQVPAINIEHGDIIDGPDGRSTVTCIRGNKNFLQFDFAEGKGNRCWLTQRTNVIGRYRKTDCPIPSGFAVNHNGEVFESYIAEVSEKNGILLITRADATKSTLRKVDIHHISGNFNLVF